MKCPRCSDGDVGSETFVLCNRCGWVQVSPPADLLTDWQVLDAMEGWGGSFAQGLSLIARIADEVNLARIKATWPEYWRQYSDMAKTKIAADAASIERVQSVKIDMPNAEADVSPASDDNVRPLVGDLYSIHHACGGHLIVMGECSVGYGVVNTLRCDKCAKEMDATCYDQFEGYYYQRSANSGIDVRKSK